MVIINKVLMSYWEIWNSFTKVKHNWEETRELLLLFIDFLTQKTYIERHYAAGLQKLARCGLFTKSRNSLDSSIKGLQISCSQQSLNLNTLIDQQQSEIIPSIRALIESQDEILKSKARIVKDFEYELQKTENKIEKAKEFYFGACDICKSPGKNEGIAEKKYIQAVEQGNQFLKLYEENMKPIFEICQDHDEKKIEMFKDALIKFSIYEMAYTRSVQYELELLPNLIELIDPKKETIKFIYDSISVVPFRPYSIDIHPKRIATELDEFLDSPEEIVVKILNKCWSEIIIIDAEYQELFKIFGIKEARICLVKKIIEKKNKQEFAIPNKTFLGTCKVFSLLLDRCLELKDFCVINQAYELFQCFYEERKKQYVFEVLCNHPVWEYFNIWSQVIVKTVKMGIESDSKAFAEKQEVMGQGVKLEPLDNKTIGEYLNLMKQLNNDSSKGEYRDFELFTFIQFSYAFE